MYAETGFHFPKRVTNHRVLNTPCHPSGANPKETRVNSKRRAIHGLWFLRTWISFLLSSFIFKRRKRSVSFTRWAQERWSTPLHRGSTPSHRAGSTSVGMETGWESAFAFLYGADFTCILHLTETKRRTHPSVAVAPDAPVPSPGAEDALGGCFQFSPLASAQDQLHCAYLGVCTWTCLCFLFFQKA